MNKTLLIGLTLFSLALGGKYTLEKKNWVKPPTTPNLKPLLAGYHGDSLEKHSLGFNSLIAASIWVQLLQLADHRPVKDDEVTWEYAQLDALTTLDPNNERAYHFGSIFLSVLRRDKLGGRLFLEKWVNKNMNYWRPHYMLGSHYYLELGDYAKAGPLILRASLMNKAPLWMSSLGIRLMSEGGALFNALKLSVELSDQIKDPEALARIYLRIRSLNYNLQKKNLEDALVHYRAATKSEPQSLSELVPYLNSGLRELSSLDSEEIENTETRKHLHEKFAFVYSTNSKAIEPLDPKAVSDIAKVGITVPVSAVEKKPQNAGTQNEK